MDSSPGHTKSIDTQEATHEKPEGEEEKRIADERVNRKQSDDDGVVG